MAKKVKTEEAEVKTAAAEPKKKTTAKKTAKKELTAEESVVILACLNTNFLEKLNKLAEKEGLKLVLTNEQVIHDYVAQQSGEIDESARMTAFLKDDRNRKVAFAHAKEIFSILARTKDLTKAADLEFEKKMLVKATTLSWKKADEMLNTLEAFGYAKRIDNNKFKIIFDLKDIQSQLGHSSIKITMDIYTHMDLTAKTKVSNWLEGGVNELLTSQPVKAHKIP